MVTVAVCFALVVLQEKSCCAATTEYRLLMLLYLKLHTPYYLLRGKAIPALKQSSSRCCNTAVKKNIYPPAPPAPEAVQNRLKGQNK
jgi:hypothetical protein